MFINLYIEVEKYKGPVKFHKAGEIKVDYFVAELVKHAMVQFF